MFFIKRTQGIIASARSWNKRRLKSYRAARDRSNSDSRATLCAMIIVKNEVFNIMEWADHYFWQGASHLFVIDNGCTDETIEVLQSHHRSSDITIFNLPRPYRQAEHYRHVFKSAKIRKRFKWLIIADGDEFWFSPSGHSLVAVLESMNDLDLIYCNWTNFGSSSHQAHPSSLRRELLQCAPTLGPHALTKWAARTDAIRRISQIRVHKVSGCRSTHTASDNENLQINHYVTQSLRFWTEVKMKRGDVFDPVNEKARNMRMFDELEASFTAIDDKLSRQLGAIQKDTSHT